MELGMTRDGRKVFKKKITDVDKRFLNKKNKVGLFGAKKLMDHKVSFRRFRSKFCSGTLREGNEREG